MADKKDENQGAELPEDDTPMDGMPDKAKTDDIVDAEFEEIPAERTEEDVTDPAEPDPDALEDDVASDAPETDETVEPVEDGDVIDPAESDPVAIDPVDADPVTDPDVMADEDPITDPEPDPEPAPPPPMPTETVVKKTVVQKRGFWPVFIGGVIAAGAHGGGTAPALRAAAAPVGATIGNSTRTV